MRPPGDVVCVPCPSRNHAKISRLRKQLVPYENRHFHTEDPNFYPQKLEKSQALDEAMRAGSPCSQAPNI